MLSSNKLDLVGTLEGQKKQLFVLFTAIIEGKKAKMGILTGEW